jgi:uncharacterized membrane protein YfcA
MVQALGLSFTIASLALAVRLGGLATPLQWPDPWASAIALAAAFAGMALGTRLRTRLPPLVFQRVLFGVFMLLGGLTLARA